MKLALILLPLLSFLNVNSPVYLHKHDKRFIQNTNLNFETIDLSKLELTFFQEGCFSHDKYHLKFTKALNGYDVSLYGLSSYSYYHLNTDRLITTSFISKDSLLAIKEMLVTDQTRHTTMNNQIEIAYNGALYTFNDNHPAPKWQRFVYKLINKAGDQVSVSNTYYEYK
jgi:hypothetical protein